jgi:hypothetical protein
MNDWKNKYLKYKSKYLNLKKLLGGFDNFTDEIREINKDSTLNYDYLIKYFITNYDCISRAILFLDLQSEQLGTDTCYNYTFTAIDSFLESRCYATVKLFNYIFEDKTINMSLELEEIFLHMGKYNNYGIWLKDYCDKHTITNPKEIIEISIKKILSMSQKPLIFEFNIGAMPETNFSGHIGNLIYIPYDTQPTNLLKGRYYCIQSFVFSYYPIQKEISFDDFIRYLMIYIYKFNLKDNKNIFIPYDIKQISKSDYYEVTWNSPVTYNLDKLYGKILNPDITIKFLENYEEIYSKLIYILCTMLMLLKIVNYILKNYLNLNFDKKIDISYDIKKYKKVHSVPYFDMKFNFMEKIIKNNNLIVIENIFAELLNKSFDEIKFHELYNHEKIFATDLNIIIKNKLLNTQKINVKHYANLFNAVKNLVNMNKKSFTSYINVIYKLKKNIKEQQHYNIIFVDNNVFSVKDLSNLIIKIKNYITSDNISIPQFKNISPIFAYFGLLNVLQLNFGSQLKLSKKHKYTDYFDLSYYFIINILNNIELNKSYNDIELIKYGLRNKFDIYNYSCECKQKQPDCNCVIHIRIKTIMMYSFLSYYKILEKIFPDFKIILDQILISPSPTSSPESDQESDPEPYQEPYLGPEPDPEPDPEPYPEQQQEEEQLSP